LFCVEKNEKTKGKKIKKRSAPREKKKVIDSKNTRGRRLFF